MGERGKGIIIIIIIIRIVMGHEEKNKLFLDILCIVGVHSGGGPSLGLSLREKKIQKKKKKKKKKKMKKKENEKRKEEKKKEKEIN